MKSVFKPLVTYFYKVFENIRKYSLRTPEIKKKKRLKCQKLKKTWASARANVSCKKKCSCSAAICQIGPRFVKIGPNPDHFLVQVRTKSGPRGASNPDLSSEIRLLLDFYEYSRLFKPYETCNISLSACKKDHFQGSFFNF